MTKAKRSHHKKPSAEVPAPAPLTESQRILAQLQALKTGLELAANGMEAAERGVFE